MGGIRGILSGQDPPLFADPSDLHEGSLGHFLRAKMFGAALHPFEAAPINIFFLKDEEEGP